MRSNDITVVNGETALFGIIGHPIRQVRSPTAINSLFAKAKANAVLVPLHVIPEQFDRTLSGLMELGNLQGLIVTVPFKFQAAKLVQKVLPTARRTGAVNVLRKEPDGTWTGDNFDGKGFVRALLDQGVTPTGLRVLLLGAGGAGAAIADALLEAGVGHLSVHDVSERKGRQLAAQLKQNHSISAVAYAKLDINRVDLLINATPIGMKSSDGLPIQVTKLPSDLIIADIVTPPEPTPLLRLASASGCQCINGQAMYDGQAFELMSFLLHR